MSTLLIAGSSFIGGMSVTAVLVRWRSRRRPELDPFALLRRPATKQLADFSEALHSQLRDWAKPGRRISKRGPQNVRQVLGCLSVYSDGVAVWTVRDGTLTFQDGTTTPISAFAAALERELTAARSPISRLSLPNLLSVDLRANRVMQFEDHWIVQRFIRLGRRGEDEDIYEPWAGYDTGMSKDAALQALDECERQWPEHKFRAHRVRMHEKLASEAIARARASANNR
jgi:hypothetical protein